MEDDAIAIGVFEGHALAVPVGIERGNGRETGISHRFNCGFPFFSVGKIKDQKIVSGWGTPGRMRGHA